MTRTILSTVLLLTCSVLCQAQEKTSDYYWYRGKQIEVKVNHDNLLVYYKNPSVTEEHLIQTYGIKPEGVAEQDYDYDKEIYYNVFSFDSNQYDSIYQGLLREENVLSVQRCYGEDIPTPTGRHFYVNLKSAEDISLLEDIAEKTSTRVAKKLSFGNWYSIETNKESVGDALTCSNVFAETALFEGVDPAFFMNIEPQATVTDTNFDTQWYLSDSIDGINIQRAWDYTTGNPNIKIAVFDGGIRKDHAEIPSSKISYAYDLITNTTSPSSYSVHSNHGTAIAGIIAADHNNLKVAGIAPDCKLIDIRYIFKENSTHRINPDKVAEGFIKAMNHGADVISCSWGSHPNSNPFLSYNVEQSIDSVITYGRNGLGCVVVFASGNDGNVCNYPGRYNSDVLVVGATQRNGNVWGNSNRGPELDIVAPGVEIYTTSVPASGDNQCDFYTGTSFAAPQVSATAALILSVAPQLTCQQVVSLILNNARKKMYDTDSYGNHVGVSYSTTPGHPYGAWNGKYGYGVLNVTNALVTDYSNPNINIETHVEGCFVNISNTQTNENPLHVRTYTRAVVDGLFYVSEGSLFTVNENPPSDLWDENDY